MDLKKLHPGKTRTEVFETLTERYRNFAFRIQNNPTVREHLQRRQNGRCLGCDQLLSNVAGHIHHITYERVCRTGDSYKNTPPCGDCPDLIKCLEKLALLCNPCHTKVHSSGEDSTASIVTTGTKPTLDLLRSTAYPSLKKRWTKEEDTRLAEMWEQGVSLNSISIALGRSRNALVLRLMHVGLAKTRKDVKNRRHSNRDDDDNLP